MKQISFNACITHRFDARGDSIRNLRFALRWLSGEVTGNDEAFAFCQNAFSLEDFNANGAIQLSVGQDPVSHDDERLLAELIDDNIFDFGRFHLGNPLFAVESIAEW
jgi:hypothetical protein